MFAGTSVMQVHSDGARSLGIRKLYRFGLAIGNTIPFLGRAFFDPGNAVYYLAFSMIWPRLLAEYGWNAW